MSAYYRGSDHTITAIDILTKLDLCEPFGRQHLTGLRTVGSVDLKEEGTLGGQMLTSHPGNGTIEQEWIIIGHKKGHLRLVFQYDR